MITQDCLELAEAHVDKVETDLAKERSRGILITKDLVALEKAAGYKIEELEAAVKASDARAEAAEKKCYENHLMNQVGYYKTIKYYKRRNVYIIPFIFLFLLYS